MLKVLHCCYDDPDNPWVGGGGARRVFDLYRQLAGRVTATIATGSYPGARTGPLEGIDVLRLGSSITYSASRITYAVAASRFLRNATYDVAVVDHSGYAPVIIPRDRAVGVTVHHLAGPAALTRWGVLPGTLVSHTERFALRRARVMSATSRATERALESIVSPRTTIHPIASGVPDRFFELPRQEQGYVLYLGRLDEQQKGLDVLLDAWALVAGVNADVHLRLAGRGPHEASLRARAAAAGISHRVTFLGEVPDAERDTLLAGATCQVVPSRFEGFGIAAAEGLAAGVPLIVSDDPALVEIVGPDAGVVVPRGQPLVLADAIISLLGNPQSRRTIAIAAKARAERFRWSVVAEGHLGFVHSILSSHEAAS